MKTMKSSQLQPKALIVGINSTIGKELKATLINAGWEVFGTTRRQEEANTHNIFVDLADINLSYLDLQIDVVYLCANVTKVASCEENKHYAYSVNVEAQLELAKYFISRGAYVVYLSSCAVFSGDRPNYHINDSTCPATYYGKCKVEVEEVLLSSSKNVAILRLAKVLTSDFKLFRNWLNSLTQGQQIEPFNNLAISPVPVDLVATCLKTIGANKLAGIIHLSGTGDYTYEDIAKYLANLVGANTKLIRPRPVDTHKPHEIRYASLDMSESSNLLNIGPIYFVDTMKKLYGELKQ